MAGAPSVQTHVQVQIEPLSSAGVQRSARAARGHSRRARTAKAAATKRRSLNNPDIGPSNGKTPNFGQSHPRRRRGRRFVTGAGAYPGWRFLCWRWPGVTFIVTRPGRTSVGTILKKGGLSIARPAIGADPGQRCARLAVYGDIPFDDAPEFAQRWLVKWHFCAMRIDQHVGVDRNHGGSSR
jgi:hypothetical protein